MALVVKNPLAIAGDKKCALNPSVGKIPWRTSSVGREATRAVSGGRPSVAEALRAHASVICLQHPSLAPHSAAKQVSLNLKKKKKKNSVLNHPLCVRAGTRH